jgi:hypothetical protein
MNKFGKFGQQLKTTQMKSWAEYALKKLNSLEQCKV